MRIRLVPYGDGEGFEGVAGGVCSCVYVCACACMCIYIFCMGCLLF